MWGDTFDKTKCNTNEAEKGGTTPVGAFSPQGDSPYGCADMSGNIWEWTHSLNKPYPYKRYDGREDVNASDYHVLRGGSFYGNGKYARCASRYHYPFISFSNFDKLRGFRMVLSTDLS